MTTPDELRAQAAALIARATELDTPLTQTDVSAMYRARRYDDIEQARKDGRLNNLFDPSNNDPKEAA